MNALSQFQHSLDHVRDSLIDGWHQLRDKTSQALTRFRPNQQRAPSTLASDHDAYLPADTPNWGLLAGEVFEDDDRVIVRLEAPGLDKRDLEIDLQGETLWIRGEKHFQHEGKRGRFQVTECAYGSFQRLFSLPAPVQAEAAKASYRNGVLRVELPKTENARRRHVEISVK